MWAMSVASDPAMAGLGIEQQLGLIADAGFDGVNVDVDGLERTRVIAEYLRGRGLSWSAVCAPATIKDLEPVLSAAADLGATQIHLQPDIRLPEVDGALPFVRAWQSMADAASMPVHFETHRNRVTNDLFFTLALLRAVPTMKLTADLSHFIVGREMDSPLTEENERLLAPLIERAESIHGRVASADQVQVQPLFPQHRRWVDLFLSWCEKGFRSWRARTTPESTLTFVTELGPPPYAITGADGRELSDRWSDALWMMGAVREVWSRLEREHV
jgi:hypothetical protein